MDVKLDAGAKSEPPDLILLTKLCSPASPKLHLSNATGIPLHDSRPRLLETTPCTASDPPKWLSSVTLSSHPCLFSPTCPTDPGRAVPHPQQTWSPSSPPSVCRQHLPREDLECLGLQLAPLDQEEKSLRTCCVMSSWGWKWEGKGLIRMLLHLPRCKLSGQESSSSINVC